MLASKLGPLFKCFGSKWQGARHYPAPKFETIHEPFAGGAGYSLYYADRQVRLTETYPQLHDLWGWLIGSATEANVRDIPLNVPAGTDIRTLGLNAGQQLLLKWWQKPVNFGENWKISTWGHRPGQWTANTRARVAEQIYGVKHWQLGAWEPRAAVTTFCDPPYKYNYHYLQPRIDYEALGRRLRSLPSPGHLIVCEAVGKQEELPEWLPFQPHRTAVNCKRGHSAELIYTEDL